MHSGEKHGLLHSKCSYTIVILLMQSFNEPILETEKFSRFFVQERSPLIREHLSNLTNLVSSLDLLHLKSIVDSENAKKLSYHEKVHSWKLLRLRIDTSAPSTDPDKVIFNYSSNF